MIQKIFSLNNSIFTMLLFAFSCAVGTFVENEYGSKVAYSLVYNSLWFEAILLFLVLSTLNNIYLYKMYKIKKLSTFLVHLSFLFLFLGAFLTRYYGFEGTITISEKTKNDIVKSYDDYLIFGQYKKRITSKDLIQNDFEFNSNGYLIKLKTYVPNATQILFKNQSQNAIIQVYLSTINGYENLFFKENDILKRQNYCIGFNKQCSNENIIVSFKKENEKIFIYTNISYDVSSKDNTTNEKIQKDRWNELLVNQNYTIGQLSFFVENYVSSGYIGLVNTHDKNFLDIISLEISKDDKVHEINLYKNQLKAFEIDGKKFDVKFGSDDIKLPFEIYLEDFILKKYPGSNSPSEFKSEVKIFENNNFLFDYTIFMNNVLDFKGYRFFQSSYKMDESATILSVNKDPGKIPTYIGYAMLFLGLILNIFSKNSRFARLSNTKYKLENFVSLLLVILFFNGISAYSNEKALDIDKNYAKEFSTILVQDYQGRIKPIDTLSTEIFNKITKKEKYQNLDTNQLFLSMIIYPTYWQNISFIKVKNKEITKLLNAKEENFLAFNELFDENNIYKIETEIFQARSKKPSSRNEFDKEILKLDERVNILYNLFSGAFLKIFPLIEDKNSKWIDPTLLFSKEELISLNDRNNLHILMEKLLVSFEDMNQTKIIDEIKTYQKQYAKDIIPSDFKVSQEILFNSLNIFDKLVFIYLILGFALFIFYYINIFKQSKKILFLYNSFKFLLVVSFIFHTYGLGLRWYISGHAPWSNGYESMIYISWAIIVAGLIFSKKSFLSLSMSSILCAITLFVAHLSWLEPQITTLTPVLKSYWLTIHVSVITASYGFFGLSCILGLFTLVLLVVLNQNIKNKKYQVLMLSIKESRRVNELSMILGIVFLVIGNFLGAIWANESWGRYWGWNPKETWTLVSILIYSAIFHLEYTKIKLSDYYFSALSVMAFCSIIMTYFGVNYYLSGMHSYASGDPLPIPTFIPISIGVFIVILCLSYKNRRI